LTSGRDTHGEKVREEAQRGAKSTSPKAERAPSSGRGPSGMKPSAATWLAWSTCAVSLALTAIGILLLVLSQAHRDVPVFEEWVENSVIAVGFSTVGAIVAPRFPFRNPIGWLFCAIGFVAAMILFGSEYAYYALLARPGSLPSGDELAWIVSWLWVVHAGLFAFLALLFPDGRLPTRRWRPFAWLVGAAVVVGSVTSALSPGPIGGLSTIRNPLGIQGAPNFSGLVEVLMYSLTLAAAASLLARLRGAGDLERQQIKWFAYAAAVAAGGAIVSYVVSDAVDVRWLHWNIGFVATVVGLAGLPVAMGVAIVKYRLHDIDLIISLTLIYAILTAAMAGIFEVSVVALQHLVLVLAHVEDSQLAYFATAMVMAALFEPLRKRIDAFVERRFFRRNNEDGGDQPPS
jgi:hypothetical protein